jgi:hypothetical protein
MAKWTYSNFTRSVQRTPTIVYDLVMYAQCIGAEMSTNFGVL